MAILTADGVKFGFDDDLNSRRQIFDVNTAWIFYQNTTPTGWTKVSQDNKALRVVSGSGGGSGGTNSFTSTFSPKTIGGTINFSVGGGNHPLTTPQIAAHAHGNGGEVGLSGTAAHLTQLELKLVGPGVMLHGHLLEIMAGLETLRVPVTQVVETTTLTQQALHQLRLPIKQ